MKTIQKRADELKPGDVVEIEGKGTCSYLYASRTGFEDTSWAIFGKHSNGNHFKREVNAHDVFVVRTPALTPAQEHAEELLALVRDVKLRVVDPAQLIPQRIDVLLAKIDPPKAPAYEEVLAALQGVMSDATAWREVSRDILDRARRAQVLHD